MSAPSKPWEGTGRQPPFNGYIDDLGYPPRAAGVGVPGPPPPLPPRRQAQFGLNSNHFGGYGGYNNYSPYGAQYGGYGMQFPSFRSPLDPRSGYGMEDGQSPFQSIESVVRAISSLAMMVDSTYQSMFMSFRAVMGVAENMDRLRRVALDLFGSIAVVKSVVWFFKKILYVMGLISNNPSRERLWEAAVAEVSSAAPEAARRTWPLVAFFGLMLGGPYVLYKLVPNPVPNWDPRQDGVQCVALYDFNTDQPGELPFRRGEVLVRQRSARGGWALAAKRNGQKGYVPSDRLKPISPMQLKAVHQHTAPPHRAETLRVEVPAVDPPVVVDSTSEEVPEVPPGQGQ